MVARRAGAGCPSGCGQREALSKATVGRSWAAPSGALPVSPLRHLALSTSCPPAPSAAALLEGRLSRAHECVPHSATCRLGGGVEVLAKASRLAPTCCELAGGEVDQARRAAPA